MGIPVSDLSAEPLLEVLAFKSVKVPVTLKEYQENCLRVMAVKYFHKFCVNLNQVDLIFLQLLCHGFIGNFTNIIPYYLSQQGPIDKFLQIFDRHQSVILRYIDLSARIFKSVSLTMGDGL